MYREVLGRWWDALPRRLDHPMVDRRNSTRRQLNRLAHLLRRVNGELDGDEITASGDRHFAVGDRITARAPPSRPPRRRRPTRMSATERSAPSPCAPTDVTQPTTR